MTRTKRTWLQYRNLHTYMRKTLPLSNISFSLTKGILNILDVLKASKRAF